MKESVPFVTEMVNFTLFINASYILTQEESTLLDNIIYRLVCSINLFHRCRLTGKYTKQISSTL